MNEAPVNQANKQVGNKQFMTTWLLSLLLGGLGVDRFYLGKIGTGLAKLFTFGGLGVWWLVDLILVLTNSMKDKDGNALVGYEDGNNKKIALFVSIGLVVLSMIFGGANGASRVNNANNLLDNTTLTELESVDANTTDSTAAPTTEAPTTSEETPVTSSETISQKNAIKSAESYLDYTAFSREGLIDQLVYEKYSVEDATYAVDQLSVDWNEQAAKSAQSYLDYSSFSRQGLIDQLVYEKFTAEQATHGADAVGM